MCRIKHICIVVPCYNEQEVLHQTTERLLDICRRLREIDGCEETRILYVDDGSRDQTWSIIDRLSSEHNEICGLKLAHNAGHQNALWAGLNYVCSWASAIVSIDADLQDDENCIIEMAQKCKDGADVVYGVRASRETDSWFKRSTARGFYSFMTAMGADIVYDHADFRLTSQAATAALLSMPERNLFLRGMVRLVGFKEDTVTYDRSERTAGESKYPLSKMISFAVDGITSFSVKPLRMILWVGAIFMVAAIIAATFALVQYCRGEVIPGWASLMISLWMIGGATLLAIGTVGEYVGKIYKEVKRRPLFFIERTSGQKMCNTQSGSI